MGFDIEDWYSKIRELRAEVLDALIRYRIDIAAADEVIQTEQAYFSVIDGFLAEYHAAVLDGS